MTASYLLVRANYKTIKSALMTASYLLSVLSFVITGCLDFRLIYANYMSGGICSLFKVVKRPIEDNKALMTASYLLSVLSITIS